MGITTIEQVLLLPSVPYRRRGFLPSSAGLYFAVIDDEYVAYIGISTTSMRQRWAGHNRKRSVQEMGAVRIAFLESNDLGELRAIEKESISTLNPSLNIHHKPRHPGIADSAGMGDDPLVGLAEASEKTGLSREAIRKMFHAGLLPGSMRVGNTIGVPDSQVKRLIAAPKRHGGWPKGKPRKHPPTP